MKNDTFYGVVNKHYYVYGSNVNSKKNSVRKDFVICRKNYINELGPYRQVEKYITAASSGLIRRKTNHDC